MTLSTKAAVIKEAEKMLGISKAELKRQFSQFVKDVKKVIGGIKIYVDKIGHPQATAKFEKAKAGIKAKIKKLPGMLKLDLKLMKRKVKKVERKCLK